MGVTKCKKWLVTCSADTMIKNKAAWGSVGAIKCKRWIVTCSADPMIKKYGCVGISGGN